MFTAWTAAAATAAKLKFCHSVTAVRCRTLWYQSRTVAASCGHSVVHRRGHPRDALSGAACPQSAPDPKICISYGACGNSGGIFHDLYCVWGGTDKIVPVDVYIHGCPPTPAATLYGFAMALGLLEQKIHARAP